MIIGGKYNWKGQRERLVYIGRNWSGNGYWHQFELVGRPGIVWCEVVDADLAQFEESASAAPTPPVDAVLGEPVAQPFGPIYSDEEEALCRAATSPAAQAPAQAREVARLAQEAKTWIAQVAIAGHRHSPAQIKVAVEAMEAFIDRLAALATPPAQPVLAPVVREPLSDAQLEAARHAEYHNRY